MTELEQYKKAYATLVGRVDTVITDLERMDRRVIMDKAVAEFAADTLTNALQEVEEIFLAEDPEE